MDSGDEGVVVEREEKRVKPCLASLNDVPMLGFLVSDEIHFARLPHKLTRQNATKFPPLQICCLVKSEIRRTRAFNLMKEHSRPPASDRRQRSGSNFGLSVSNAVPRSKEPIFQRTPARNLSSRRERRHDALFHCVIFA